MNARMVRIIVLALLVICTTAANSQSVRQKKFALKMNVLSATVKTLNFSSEYAFSKRFSGQLGFFRTQDFHFREHVLSGRAFTMELRIHLHKSYLKGLYIAPFFRSRKLIWDIPSKNAGADFISNGGGFTFGYQWVIKNLVIIDFFAGPTFASHNLKVRAGAAGDFKLPITTAAGVRSGIGLGFAIF